MNRGIAALLGGVALSVGWAVPASAVSSTPTPTFVTDGTVEAVAQAGNTTYIGGTFTQVGPRTGPAAAVDATSGQADLSMPQVSGGEAVVNAVASDGSGGWYLAGSFTHVGGLARGNVAHILANKTVDATFAPEVSGGAVKAIAASGSTVYIGGQFTAVGGQPRSALAALDARGQPTSWNPGVNSGGAVEALALSGSSVIVGGIFNSVDGIPEDGITAVDATTGLPTWAAGANADSVQVDTLAVSGSTVYAGGSFGSIGGQPRTCLAALDATTGAATPWDPTLDSPYGCNVESMALSGAIVYVDGDFDAVDGQSRHGLAAIDTTTGSPTAWDPPLKFCCASGPLAASSSTVYLGLSAIDASTGSFTSWNPKPNGGVLAVALSGSTVYAGGSFSSLNGQPRNKLAALGADGSLTAWNPNPANSGGIRPEIQALSVSGSTVYAGGTFDSIGGQPRTAIAALDPSTGQATAWNANLVCSRLYCNPSVGAIATSGSNVYVAGVFDSIGGQPRNGAAALDSATALATPWNPNPNVNGLISALAVSDSVVYAAGSFSTIGGQPRSNLAALDPTTGQATGWNPNVTCGSKCSPTRGNVGALALSGPTMYIGGYFDSVGGQPRSNLAAVSVSTASPTGWSPDTNGLVRSLAVSGSTVYAGGDFTTVAGQARGHLASLATGSGALGAFDPEPNDAVYALAATPTGTLDVGGAFTTLDLSANQGFAQFGR